MYAQIALPLPLKKILTYKVPEKWEGEIKLGQSVKVPLESRRIMGWLVGLSFKTDLTKVKEITQILDSEPVFSEELLSLCRWISEYYFCSWGEVLKAALPGRFDSKNILWMRRIHSFQLNNDENLSPNQKEILKSLEQKKGLKVSSLKKILGKKDVHSDLRSLERKGAIQIYYKEEPPRIKIKYEKIVQLKDFDNSEERINHLEEKIKTIEKKFSSQAEALRILLNNNGEMKLKDLKAIKKNIGAALKKLEKKGWIEIICREQIRKPMLGFDFQKNWDFELNSEQKKVVSLIGEALKEKRYRTFLLYGVTGSGKTKVYLEAIKEALACGKRALVLVPEISLTPQTIYFFQSSLDKKIGCLHSRLSSGERFDTWRRIKRGEFDVVVGPRSAIFAPLDNLGLIVVDEEHDSSFKQQDQNPRYNARDVAVMRGKLNEAVVILGSATPSLESFYNAQKGPDQPGKYTLCQLEKRVEGKPLPEVKIVDMKKEREGGNFTPFSRELLSSMEKELSKNQQVILFLNRRGFSRIVKCQDCGFVYRCPNCNISLVFHLKDLTLRCHYCNYKMKPSSICPQCQSFRFSYKGIGTEKIEEDVKKYFLGVRLGRMDRDTTRKKDAHFKILSDFSQKNFNLLLGTQMITKGLDFPDVTLVGVLSADFNIDFPDFRSKERTFQLLTQVAGRAGRGEQEGEVLIQTYYPDDWAIKLSAEQNYLDFYTKEIAERKNLFYPPFSHLILIQFIGENLNKVIELSDAFGKALKGKRLTQTQILGPAPAPLAFLKRKNRWQILMKTKRLKHALKTIDLILEGKIFKSAGSVRIGIDVDPVGIM